MIREALDNSSFACGIFIDLQKAFNTVDHQILLKKLEYNGIEMKSFLNTRKIIHIPVIIKTTTCKITYNYLSQLIYNRTSTQICIIIMKE